MHLLFWQHKFEFADILSQTNEMRLGLISIKKKRKHHTPDIPERMLRKKPTGLQNPYDKKMVTDKLLLKFKAQPNLKIVWVGATSNIPQTGRSKLSLGYPDNKQLYPRSSGRTTQVWEKVTLLT